MSSPTILTSVRVPFAEAHAANIEDTARYLTLAREVYDQALRLREETIAFGGRLLQDPLVPYEEAEARANALLYNGKTAGFEGVEYAHAYWQELKHPWFERVLRVHSELRAVRDQQDRAEAARLTEVARLAGQALNLQVDVDRLQVSAPQAGELSLEGKVAAALEAILQLADTQGLAAVRDIALRSAALGMPERLLALETFLLRLAQEVKQRRQQEALRCYEERQRQLAAERIAVRVEQSRRKLESLETDAAPTLEAELQTLSAAPPSLHVEERIQELEQRIAGAARQQGLLEAAVAALRQQGYETVQVMQTLGPPEIMSAYLQDPRDEGRVALLQVAAERGLVSAEVVRRDAANGSQQQKSLDREAQGRLCKAMESVERALAAQWQCEVKRRAAPGEAEPKVNPKVPARGKRTRVAAALRARAVS